MDKTKEIAEAVIAELDHFAENFRPSGVRLTYGTQLELTREPCIGYMEAKDKQGEQVQIFVCRNYTPTSFEPKEPNAMICQLQISARAIDYQEAGAKSQVHRYQER